MKRGIAILCCVALLALAGCGREDPYRVDTVIRIPVDPTEAPTEQPTGETESVPPVTEEPTEEAPTETVPEETKSAGEKKPSSSGNRKPSGSGSTQTEPVATEPPATEPPETEGAYDPAGYAVGSLEYAILDAINGYRVEAGLPELTLSTRLCGIAALRAEEVSRVWSHTRPDGRHYTSAMSDYGYGYGVSAENLAYASGSGDGAAMVSKWMDAGNRDSLLNPDFTTAGIGVYRSGGVTYVANILIG